MGIEQGVCLGKGGGVIGSGYRGEIGVGLVNLGQSASAVQPGDRSAQLGVTPVVRPTVVQVSALDDTDRGAGGFGSTGR